jgi:hypothetical protein
MDLVEFLQARLDADAAYVQGGTCNCWQPTDNGKCDNLPDCPARVLAEVEAKRKIVDLWEDPYEVPEHERERYFEAERTTEILRLLALPYARHPDYDEAWRPQSTNLV